MHGKGEIEHVNGQKRIGIWENDIHLNWLQDEIAANLMSRYN